jgi:hypothetical protein
VNRRLSRLLTVAVVGASLLGATAALSTTALAHSELVESTPTDGEVLPRPPEQVQLTFGEDVQSQGSGIVVKSPSGERVDAPETFSVDGNVASIDLLSSTQDDGVYTDGQYTVSYRIVSADGHIVSGSYDFRLRGTPSSESPRPSLTSTLNATPAADPSPSSDTGVIWVLGLGAIGIVLVAAVISVAVRGRRGR